MKGMKVVIFLVILAVIAGGVMFIVNSCNNAQPAGGGENGIEGELTNAVPVITREAVRGNITETTRRVAVVEGSESVLVVPSIGGRAEVVNVRVGDRVTAGQLLVQLEQRDLLVQLQQAEASLVQAEAGLAQSEASLVQAEAGLAVVEAGRSSALARLDDARATLERAERLYEEGAVPRQQVEQARLQYQLSSLETFEAQIEQARAGVGQAQAGVGQAHTGMGQALAGINIIQNQLDHTIISAPMSGVVTAVNISVGEMAGPSLPIVEITHLDEVEIPVGVIEQHINALRVGDSVEVSISAVREEPFIGTIRNIPPAADQMTRTFPVTIALSNPDHTIRSGMFAEVSLVTNNRQGVVIVPMVAVVDQGIRQTIFVVENGEAISRQIQLGINDGHYVEVISGIEEGEEIIVRGQHIVSHGYPVMVDQGGEE